MINGSSIRVRWGVSAPVGWSTMLVLITTAALVIVGCDPLRGTAPRMTENAQRATLTAIAHSQNQIMASHTAVYLTATVIAGPTLAAATPEAALIARTDQAMALACGTLVSIGVIAVLLALLVRRMTRVR